MRVSRRFFFNYPRSSSWMAMRGDAGAETTGWTVQGTLEESRVTYLQED